MKISEFVSTRRRVLGLTQDEVARRCRLRAPAVSGVQRASVAFWERGERIPNPAQLEALFRALDAGDDDRASVLRKAAS